MKALVPDLAPARAVDWSAVGVEADWYDPKDESPAFDERTEVLVVGATDHTAAFVLAEQLPHLRLVQTAYAGVEQWEGRLGEAVTLSNGRGGYGAVTAEMATLGVLAVLRRLPEFVRSQHKQTWEPHFAETLWNREVLVVGAGDIGQNVRRQMEGFGARVRLVARTARPGVHAMDELEGLLATSQVVVLAVPLNASTRGLVDAAFLATMPDGAVLGNVGRGGLVDTQALVDEASSGRIRAHLDVTDPEPLPDGHPFWTCPGLLITPHVGGAVEQAAHAGMEVAARQVAQFARGELPDNTLVKGALPDRFVAAVREG